MPQEHPNAPTIYIKQATLSYQSKLLFTDLNLTLPAGKWTCLLGPSGVGKTSLLRLIAGLTSDVVSKNPITTSDDKPLIGRLSYMAQEDLLLPWSSALANVLLGAKLRGANIHREALQQKAAQLLMQVGLQTALHKKPAQLSGGMRQRVALARTLMENRPVVLMDEPFAAVDAITRLRLQELAAELLVDRTVLLITHDTLEALRLGDQIYVMSGLPAQLGTPIQPAGKTPRDPAAPAVLELQGELLHRLTQAHHETML